MRQLVDTILLVVPSTSGHSALVEPDGYDLSLSTLPTQLYSIPTVQRRLNQHLGGCSVQ